MRAIWSLSAFCRAASVTLAVSLVAASAFVGCDSRQQQIWPWWTARDSAAVREALAPWRDVLAAWPMLADTLRLGFSARLGYQDSMSPTGDTLYKFAHVLRAWFEPADSIHVDVFQFGVTADTISMRDTFCEVACRDSMAACRIHLEYDSMWVVGYRPDTIVDTTRTPPETTITYRASYTELRGFSQPQVVSKTYPWAGLRKLFLRKVTDSSYSLVKLTGFRVATPTAEDAPGITRVVLARPGKQDTLFYAPRKDGRGLYNLRPIDSLYSLRPGEPVVVEVTASTPADTIVVKNRFYLTVSERRTDITASARMGLGSASINNPGFEHLYLEVVPTSSLVYPGSVYSSTVWAVPVVIRE